jgi:addiction module HigA family antidote
MTDQAKLAPVHPGDVLLHDFMAPLGLTAYRVGKDIGVTATMISEIVRHKRAVTAKTALLLGKYLGTSPELWLGLQSDYDLETARPRYRSLVDAVLSKPTGLAVLTAEFIERLPRFADVHNVKRTAAPKRLKTSPAPASSKISKPPPSRKGVTTKASSS